MFASALNGARHSLKLLVYRVRHPKSSRFLADG
jgi:hypothetical protein